MSAIPPLMEKGMQAEARFFEVVRKEMSDPWFCGIEPVTAQEDVGGIDAIALVKRRMTGEIIRVPVQIKSSATGVVSHLSKYPHHWFLRIVFVIVNDDIADKSICAQLRHGLEHVRTHAYDYTEVFKRIERRVRIRTLLASFLRARQKYMNAGLREGGA